MKFKEIDRVKVTKGRYRGEVGTIVEAVEPKGDNDGYYIIQTRVGSPIMKVPEDSVMEYQQDIMKSMKILDYYKTGTVKPDFFVGDVVSYGENGNTEYVVDEVVTIKYAASEGYEYSIFPLNQIDNYDESKSIRVKKPSLKWKYNDKNLQEYFTESVGNSLPAWRGELYNYYIFDDNLNFNSGWLSEYNKFTIPPAYMEHILESHYIVYRIDWLIRHRKNPNKDKNRELIKRTLNIDEDELNRIEKNVKEKVKSLNLADNDIQHPGRMAKKAGIVFTEKEIQFADMICKLDDTKDHYPLNMTSLEIMYAIKQAYENAFKTGTKRGQTNKDKRTGEVFAPKKGQRVYRGESVKPKLLIEFEFDVDLQVICTAYPVKDNRNDINKNHPRG